ncbi:MAG TPA: lipoxygenase family protein, partial [Chitinophagales bacterium]|nr:lipoxygenase family protein [Chitinophagales bacterium]
NLRTIELCFWEYRDDTKLPRVVIKDHDKDAPQYYSEKRVEALAFQFIPIELTKRKHLKQIQRDPSKLSLAKIQDDYPENLTSAMEKMHPGITRSDEWFGERMMNGMNMATFLKDKTEPDHYWVKYFGACTYDINNEYAFPTSEIKFRLKEDGYPIPVAIHLTGPLNAFNKDPWQVNVFTPADGPKWEAAKRVARVNGGLCTELDEHLTATHLNMEQYAIAAYRNLHLNPLAYLLFPHLKEVVLVNHTADRILIRDYLPSATALTYDGLLHRAFNVLGLMDWKGWHPMKPLTEAHSFAKAEELFWDLTGKYVDHFFDIHLEEIKKYWYEVYMFSNELLQHSVPLFHSTIDFSKLSPEARAMEEKRLEYYTEQYRIDLTLQRSKINGETKAVSPLTLSPEFDESKPEDIQHLKDASRYMIMMASFMHTWANEHQYEDIGEVLYSCLGLRFGNKESGIIAPESDLGIAPDLTRSTQMMWFSNFLSRTEYGFITRNEEKDIDPHFSEMLLNNKEQFAKWRVDVANIESRTNI